MGQYGLSLSKGRNFRGYTKLGLELTQEGLGKAEGSKEMVTLRLDGNTSSVFENGKSFSLCVGASLQSWLLVGIVWLIILSLNLNKAPVQIFRVRNLILPVNVLILLLGKSKPRNPDG